MYFLPRQHELELFKTKNCWPKYQLSTKEARFQQNPLKKLFLSLLLITQIIIIMIINKVINCKRTAPEVPRVKNISIQSIDFLQCSSFIFLGQKGNLSLNKAGKIYNQLRGIKTLITRIRRILR